MPVDEGTLDERTGRNEPARREACRILGIDENADELAVKKAYRRACLKCHPDANPGDEKAHGRFLLVQCAYELLTKGTICDLLLEEMKSRVPAASEGKYNLDNQWGFFMWWREQIFDEPVDRRS
jgi:hypothetical protein